MRFSCGQLLVKCVIEVKRVALSMKFGSIVNLCDACNYKDVSNDRRWGQLFLNGFYPRGYIYSIILLPGGTNIRGVKISRYREDGQWLDILIERMTVLAALGSWETHPQVFGLCSQIAPLFKYVWFYFIL